MSVEEHPSGPSAISYSHIPVMAAPTPRAPPLRNAFSSFSMSSIPASKQQSRNPSTPSFLQASPASTSSTSNSITGIPKFRSLRNILPFGPKSNSPSNAVQKNAGASSSTSNVGITHRHSRSASSSPSPSPSPSARSSQKSNFLHFASRPSLNITRDGDKEKGMKSRSSLSVDVEAQRTLSADHDRSFMINAGQPTKPSGLSKIVAPRPSVVISRDFSPSIIGNTIAKEWISRPSPVRSPSPGKRPRLNGGSPLSPPSDATFLTTPTPEVRGDYLAVSGDLSTILESDTSALSMSKHLPPLSADVSQEEKEISNSLASIGDMKDRENVKGKGKQGNRFGLILSRLAKSSHERSLLILESAAINYDADTPYEEDSQTWNDGVAELKQSLRSLKTGTDEEIQREQPIVDDLGFEGSQEDSPDLGLLSFNLSVVDPDLAALLSPNNIPPSSAHHNAALLSAALDAVTPPPPLSASPSPSPDARSKPPWELGRGGSSSSSNNNMGGAMSSSHIIGPQSSPPSRKSRPTSLALSADSSQSHSTLNSLAKGGRRVSIDDTSAIALNGPVTSTPMAKDTHYSAKRSNARSSLDIGLGHAPARSRLGRSFSASSGSVVPERPATSERTRRTLYTPRNNIPDRPGSTARVTPELRPPSRSYLRERSLNSNSPVPRASSSLSHFDAYRRQNRPATHAGVEHSTTKLSLSTHSRTASERNFFTRNRRRSMSVGEVQELSLSPTPEGIYSTTRGSIVQRLQTPTFLRSNSERDLNHPGSVSSHTITTLHPTSRAPSRLLDVRTADTTNRNPSHPHAQILAELNTGIAINGESPIPTASTPTTPSRPRTALSGYVSAPVSAVCGSSSQLQISEIHSLKKKHSMDRGVLLSALHDSQAKTNALLKENAELRIHIQALEEQLSHAYKRGSEMTGTQVTSSPVLAFLNQSSLEGIPRTNSRSASRSMMNGQRFYTDTFTHPSSSSGSSLSRHTSGDTGEITRTTSTSLSSLRTESPDLSSHQLQRHSTASSVFPVVPSNMTMLLHEESHYIESSSDPYSRPQSRSRLMSSPPSSPTFIHSETLKSSSAHMANLSISSNGSISPTTANFSMLSVTGSPGSLYLKPEHERHLGDMISFDLSAEIPEVEL